MLRIKFRYKDSQSNWEWREQECTMPSVDKCIEWYSLGKDCEYEIIEVKEVDN